MTLAPAVLAGDRLALSRLLTQIENDTPTGREALNALFSHTGQAHLVGVTGAPGTGKSSLVNQLARYIRHPAEGEARKVAIVAVDPSSPFTGGAILGDRIRMRDLSGDPGVFIRSMASRGTLGGLAAATSGVVQALDAAGFDFVIIETVGAGQAEVDIARLAHTTLVIEAPGLGDEIQAIKAGILEIADILVVNKADLPGAENTERALRNMLNLAHPVKRIYHDRSHKVIEEKSEVQPDIWFPPIIRTVATEDTGFPELAKAIDQHRSFLQKEGEWERRDQERMQSELELLLRETLVRRWREGLQDGRYPQVLDRLYAREISPRQAVAELTSDA
jgi:LAO/AO transport system kinase